MTQRFELLTKLETPVLLEGERICFLRTVKHVPDCFTQVEYEKIKKEHFVHELGYFSNLSPNYQKAIDYGLLALRESADPYGQRVIDANLDLSDRYCAEAQRQGREDLAAVLKRVPRYGATSFYEALQCFRILHYSLWLEGNYHKTIGRFDQYMYPYLRADLDSGALTEETALELLLDFFLSFNKDSDLYIGVQQGDNGQSMMLGGVDEQGNDAFNLPSSMCLEASRRNKLIDPKINLRVSKVTPLERYIEATYLTAAGLGFPQYSNDDVVIPALEKLGYSHTDATNYTVAACWEFIIPVRCVWCHNPEGLTAKKQLMYKYSRCRSCNLCRQPCSHEFCKPFGRCVHVCPEKCLEVVGREVEASVLAEELKETAVVLGNSFGGFTFTGGEPFAQPEFLLEIIQLLKGYHLCIETSGYTVPEIFRIVVDQLDFVIMDIKLVKEEDHRKFTGVSNKRILTNLEYLRSAGKPCWIRTPLIPGITDTEENMALIDGLIRELPHEYLPYNPIGEAKYKMLGFDYPYVEYVNQ